MLFAQGSSICVWAGDFGPRKWCSFSVTSWASAEALSAVVARPASKSVLKDLIGIFLPVKGR